MTPLDRRHVLLALTGLAAGAATPAVAALPEIDPEGARRIGQAYLDSHPGRRFDAGRLQGDLLPDGWTPEASARLRARAAADFRAGRLFIHRGWRLSDTEGRLFALAALTPP
ncbi:MAG: hypothetical protein KKE02_13970 [Alphaproteobacteria bacterium]|nr:hypothetical protein [Alphaproteobacteria bacterium]MBU1513030.1 hypothetical protein [Alphaproteobacteria bacterium]MBU2095138.1 hypothetical protein [Alphaproteobacteria bacterium]MBU2152121.1 hypothetical protein [Alphaproteobacteria bacterium]MBU2306389.1 hypothetical protein [Alphaproteobacteria bacterium]